MSSLAYKIKYKSLNVSVNIKIEILTDKYYVSWLGFIALNLEISKCPQTMCKGLGDDQISLPVFF